MSGSDKAGSPVALFPQFFFFSSRRRHTRCLSDWSSDVCSSDLASQKLDVTRVKQIEAAVGETHAQPLAAPLGKMLFKNGPVEDNFFFRRQRCRRRSEERRVGKEWRSRCAEEHTRDKSSNVRRGG